MSTLQTYADAAYVPSPPPEPDPYGPDAPIPETWTPDHVARRLIEFRIDRRLPRINRPKSPGSAHPPITYTAEEREEWELIEIDPKRFAPQRDEVAAMERAFDWLLSVAESKAGAHFALKNWAIAKAGGRSARNFCNKKGLAWTTFLSRKAAALSLIASRLNEANEPVW